MPTRLLRQAAGRRRTGRKNYIMIQAEDELASIGMVIGAAWNGARAFTATSGPGLSLMQEFLGLAYYAEVPAVVFDIQRVGPSTGMPTRTQQGDLHSAAYASHGDTRQVCLYPANPEECFEFAVKAFDLTERLQTPVLVLSDLDIGMNDWMCPEFKWDENYQPDRGKMLDAEQLAKIDRFWRYYDHDKDGIPQRTLPGVHPKGAYFTRGSGHSQYGAYTEDSKEYQVVVDRLRKKWLTAARLVPKSVIERSEVKTEIGIVSLGSGDGRGARGTAAAGGAGHPHRLPARARLSVQRRRRAVPAVASDQLRGGAESRRAAALAADHGDRRGEDAAALDPALQRHADPGQLRLRRRRVGDHPGAASGAAGRLRSHRHDIHGKPKITHPEMPRNALGLTRRDYEGVNSTLCAGCGHDSITAAIVEACWMDALLPQDVVKLSGIGCSSKTTAYFVSGGHGFNSVHGRMPSIATGANAANRKLTYIGVSGDGDTLSIGLGQFCHAIRRNLNMVYVIENNGVYGLTKGQFSASADIGSTAKKGEVNNQPPIDPVQLAITLGAHSSRAASPATRRSWCRCCRPRCITRASR
jgi:pyruvate/2-oxoacid:ferredoxin oxidoreductase alpha subunit